MALQPPAAGEKIFPLLEFNLIVVLAAVGEKIFGDRVADAAQQERASWYQDGH